MRQILGKRPPILFGDMLNGTRLHVNIFDTANSQYTIPQSVIERPGPPRTSFKKSSDLQFNFAPKPFAFWITRRNAPNEKPIFDTRPTSFPKTPIPPVIPGDNSTALGGFPLVFEDQYLQVEYFLSFISHLTVSSRLLLLYHATPTYMGLVKLSQVPVFDGMWVQSTERFRRCGPVTSLTQ